MSYKYDGDILFFLLKADTQVNPWFFLTVHRHELLPVKILEFYLAHLCLIVTISFRFV
jgi:hypothetical protein